MTAPSIGERATTAAPPWTTKSTAKLRRIVSASARIEAASVAERDTEATDMQYSPTQP